MRILLTLLIVSSTFVLSCKKGKNNPNSFNGSGTRRDINLAIDENAFEIDTVPIVISVDSIGSLSVPEANSDTQRQEVEKLVYQITAAVHKISKHRDGNKS